MTPLVLALTLLTGSPGPFNDADGGVLAHGSRAADVTFAPGGQRAIAVWVDNRRDLAFQGGGRRGPDLWATAWADGGLSDQVGRIACPASGAEVFSQPRIVSSQLGMWVAYKATDGITDEVRTGSITSTTTGPSCGTSLSRGDAGTIDALQLAQSGTEVLALWETPREFVGAFLSNTPSGPFTILTKQTNELVSPSLGPGPDPGSFYVAWSNDGTYQSLVVDRSSVSGATVPTPVTHFAAVILDAPPSLSSRNPRTAFVGHAANDTTVKLFEGDPSPSLLGELLVPTGLASAPVTPLVERTSPARSTAVAKGAMGWFVADVATLSASSAPLPGSAVPVSMTMDALGRSLLLSHASGELELTALPSTVFSGTTVSAGVRTRNSPSELEQTAVWSDAGVFSVAFNTSAANAVYFTSNLRENAPTFPFADGGIFRLHQRADRVHFAVSVQSPVGAGLYVPLNGFASDAGMKILEWPDPSLDGALMGETLGALWSIGGSTLVYSGNGALTATTLLLGRCGAVIDGRLMVPVLLGTDQLGLVALKDEAGATPDVISLGRFPGLGLPCLSGNDRELLFTARDANGELVLLREDASSALSGTPPTRVAQATPTGAVLDPVAVPTLGGWLVAWEAPGTTGSTVRGLQLSTDGRVQAPGLLTGTTGIDQRKPRLASSPEGAVLVAWQEYVDVTGQVVIKSRLAVAPQVVRDAGVEDAGTEVDGGTSVDAGVSDAGVQGDGGVVGDGGTTLTPLVFNACGCGSSPGVSVLSLLLLVLFGRRARRS